MKTKTGRKREKGKTEKTLAFLRKKVKRGELNEKEATVIFLDFVKELEKGVKESPVSAKKHKGVSASPLKNLNGHYVPCGWRKAWLLFDLDNGDGKAEFGYVWVFASEKDALDHKHEYGKSRFAARLSDPIQISIDDTTGDLEKVKGSSAIDIFKPQGAKDLFNKALEKEGWHLTSVNGVITAKHKDGSMATGLAVPYVVYSALSTKHIIPIAEEAIIAVGEAHGIKMTLCQKK